MKKIISVFLTALMVFSLSGCANNSANKKSLYSASLSDVEFWSAPATEKVLKDAEYKGTKNAAKLDVVMAKAEYESAQIIMTPKKDVDSYDVVLGTLKNENDVVFPLENVKVYNQKYIEVRKVYDVYYTDTPTGFYPDAILPFETAKAYGENKIAAGDNQAIRFSFQTTSETAPGLYTGSFTIKIEQASKTIPVSILVYDATVSEESHFKSMFGAGWSFANGELDDTEAMYDKYSDALLEYRLCNSYISRGWVFSPEEIEKYVTKSFEYAKRPVCSTIRFPYANDVAYVTIDGVRKKQTSFDENYFKQYVIAYAKKCFDKNINPDEINIFDKLIIYFGGIIDEPSGLEAYERVREVCKKYKRCLEECADIIANDASIPEGSFKDEVVEGIKNMPHVVTKEYVSELDGYVDSWCPQFQYYGAEQQRAKYVDQREKWWYGCISPRMPYPTFHTEDFVISPRLTGWMQAEYDIVGQLFWAVNIFCKYNGSNYEPIEDYYEGDAVRFPNVNGDGYLFYPGGQYGLSTPVACIRLEAMRDGIEEYELLYEMKERIKNLGAEIEYEGADGSDVIDFIKGSNYNGATITGNSQTFAESREMLLKISEAMQSPAEMLMLSYKETEEGKIVADIFLKDGYELKYNDEAISRVNTVSGGKIYTVIKDLVTEEDGRFAISYECNGKTYGFETYIKYHVSLIEGEKIASGITANTVTPVVTLVDAGALDPELPATVVKVDMPASGKKDKQMINVNNELIAKISAEDTEGVRIMIYVEDDVTIPLSVKAKNLSGTTFEMVTCELKQGLNVVSVGFGEFVFKSKVANFILQFGTEKNEPAKTVYITQFYLYQK